MGVKDLDFGLGGVKVCELYPKLIVFPLITPIILSYIIPYTTPFSGVWTLAHVGFRVWGLGYWFRVVAGL